MPGARRHLRRHFRPGRLTLSFRRADSEVPPPAEPMLKPAPPKGLFGIIWEGAPGAAAGAPNTPACGAPNAAG